MDGYGDQYEFETFVRRLHSVQDPEMRRAQVRRHVLTVDATTVADHLYRLLRGAVRGDATCAELLLPIVEFVNHATDDVNAALDAIDLEARAADLHAVSWFLLAPPPARRIDARAMKAMRVESQSLGHRKASAALHDRRVLERLVYDDHPMVIERLLRNPRVQEPSVMTIATRRPTTPELLATISRSPRWLARMRVREGLAQNPYVDTGLALRLLPTLRPSLWKTLPHASQVHDALKSYAQYLLALRSDDPASPAPEELRRLH